MEYYSSKHFSDQVTFDHVSSTPYRLFSSQFSNLKNFFIKKCFVKLFYTTASVWSTTINNFIWYLSLTLLSHKNETQKEYT